MGAIDRFALLLASDEEGIAVEEAALVLASVFKPTLVVDEWLTRIDRLADGCAPDIESVTRRLFGELGFDGNRCGYYDQQNSMLDAVIERRTGIPITLSILLMAVARRAGLEVVGVGMPSHFLALDVRSGLWIDAFGGGVLLDRAGIETLFASLGTGAPSLDDDMLRPVGPRLIVRRMLNNLVNIAIADRDARSRILATRLRSLLPDASTVDRLDLAEAYLSCGEVVRAADVLDAAAADAPDDEHDAIARFAAEVRGRLN